MQHLAFWRSTTTRSQVSETNQTDGKVNCTGTGGRRTATVPIYRDGACLPRTCNISPISTLIGYKSHVSLTVQYNQLEKIMHAYVKDMR